MERVVSYEHVSKDLVILSGNHTFHNGDINDEGLVPQFSIKYGCKSHVSSGDVWVSLNLNKLYVEFKCPINPYPPLWITEIDDSPDAKHTILEFNKLLFYDNADFFFLCKDVAYM